MKRANADIVDLTSSGSMTKVAKREKASTGRLEAVEKIKSRLENGTRIRVSKKAAAWSVGRFTQYRSGVHDKDVVVCETCVKQENYISCEISLGHDLSPNALKTHMKAHHNDQYEELVRSTSIDPIVKRDEQGTITKFLIDDESPLYQIAKMMVMEYLPLSFVEKESFRNVILAYNKKATVVTSETIYEEMVAIKLRLQAVKDSMRAPGDRVSVAVDFWTGVDNCSYLGYTERWLDENFCLFDLPANIVQHVGDEKIATLEDYFKEVNAKFKHDDDAIDFVSDCAANMTGWGRSVASWSGCVDHRLDLITGVAFDHVGVASVTKKCRALATFHNHSSQAAHRLSEQCKFYQQDTTKLQQDVVTRWWSTHTMMESFLSLKRPLQSVMADMALENQLSAEDWNVIQFLNISLHPFMIAQKELEGGGVTSSLVITITGIIRQSLKDALQSTENLRAKSTLLAMEKKFNEKFGNGTGFTQFGNNGWNAMAGVRQQPTGFSKVQVLATALDPRTKDLFHVPVDEHALVQTLVVQAAHEENIRKKVTTGSNAPSATTQSAANSLQPPSQSQIENTAISVPLSAYDQFRFRSKAIVAPSSIAKPTLTQEIEREYLHFQAENVIDLKSDPLHWWRERKQSYPLLAVLARRVLAVPATSAGAERLFSKAKLTLTDKRNSLSGDAVTTLIWLRESWELLEGYAKSINSK